MQTTTANEMGAINASLIRKPTKFRQYYNIVRELAIVDFRKKYHDSTLGYFWSMLNPLLRFGVYYFVFSYLFISHVDKFTLYLLTGVFFWNFFQDATSSAISTIGSRARLTKTIYFPRYLLIFASCTTAFFSFAINTVLIIIVTMIFDHVSFLQFYAILPFILMLFLALGVGMILAVLFIHFRDILEIWGVIITIGFWLTPIMYEPTNIPAPLATVSLLNPVGRILVLLRRYLLYNDFLAWPFVVTTILFCLGIFVFGWWLFMKYEHRIPEYNT